MEDSRSSWALRLASRLAGRHARAWAALPKVGICPVSRSSSASQTVLTPDSCSSLSTNGGVEPTLGFEPRTCCLRNSCSTAELCRPEGEYRRSLLTGAYSRYTELAREPNLQETPSPSAGNPHTASRTTPTPDTAEPTSRIESPLYLLAVSQVDRGQGPAPSSAGIAPSCPACAVVAASLAGVALNDRAAGCQRR